MQLGSHSPSRGPGGVTAYHHRPGFQSSSSQKAGCNWSLGVNPSAFPVGPLEGAYQGLGGRLFQSSSSQKAGCNVEVVGDLLQPTGDGLQVLLMFQSSSSQKAGCIPATSMRSAYANLGLIPGVLIVFQSSSSQKAGCNFFNPAAVERSRACSMMAAAHGPSQTPYSPAVSILIQPEGRMQL